MVVTCYKISRDRQLIPLDYERAVEAVRKPGAPVWIDIQGIKTAQLDQKLNKLQVQGLAKKLCLEAEIGRVDPRWQCCRTGLCFYDRIISGISQTCLRSS